MRVTQEEMLDAHMRVVEGASRLFRERGTQAVSVAEVMDTAGMTHGGFYRHFASKSDLVDEALRAAFEEFMRPVEARMAQATPALAAAEFRSMYLSAGHVENPALGCPIPALAGDVARGEDSARAEFTRGVQRVIAALSSANSTGEAGVKSAVRDLCMMAGAIAIARAVLPEAAEVILQSCRE